MKKLIFLLLFAVSNKIIFAQNNTFEQYNTGSIYYTPPLMSGFDFSVVSAGIFSSLINIFNGETGKYDFRSSGAITLGYERVINKRWNLGLSSSFHRVNIKFEDVNAANNQQFSLNAVMPYIKASYFYKRKNNFTLYSGVQIGVCTFSDIDIDKYSNKSGYLIVKKSNFRAIAGLLVHYNLIGVKWGNKNAFSLEFGGGANSILAFGYTQKYYPQKSALNIKNK